MVDSYVHPIINEATGSKLTALNTYVICTIVTPADMVGLDNFSVKGLSKITLMLKAVTNNMHFKIEVSLDGSNWTTKFLDKFVIVGTPTPITLEESWSYMQISVKPAVAAAHGTGSFVMHGSSI